VVAYYSIVPRGELRPEGGADTLSGVPGTDKQTFKKQHRGLNARCGENFDMFPEKATQRSSSSWQYENGKVGAGTRGENRTLREGKKNAANQKSAPFSSVSNRVGERSSERARGSSAQN